MIEISVLMPSIRIFLLPKVYERISESFHGYFEMVVVSPYDMPEGLKGKNVVWINDSGSPVRCRQIGLCACNGKYICYAADDSNFYPNALDKAYDLIKDKDYKHIVLGKYSEGMKDNKETMSDEYYHLGYHRLHKSIIQRLGRDYFFVNTGLVSREFMWEVGGFDCEYEACAMACCDLSIRLQNEGGQIIIMQEPIFWSTHIAGNHGDHAPINKAQLEHDMPHYMRTYGNPKTCIRGKIPLDNWKQAPELWERRFGKSDETNIF